MELSLYSATVMLILVMDPLGNIPVFLSVLRDFEPRRRRRILIRELLIALLVMGVFLFFGKYIMQGLQISEPSLSIAGGVILFIIALRMIFPLKRAGMGEDPEDQEPFIVPLAIPMVAGPSTLATILLLATRNPARVLDWSLALVGAWLFTAVILFFSNFLSRIFGRKGLAAMERLMGMILTTIAVQMFLTGVDRFMQR